MTYIVFDTEATGLKRKHGSLNIPCSVTENEDEVIQIGGLILDSKFEPSRVFCHYCDCLLPESNFEAKRVHGISMHDVRRVVPGCFLEEVLCRYVPEFFGEDTLFIGHNVGFDMQMVAQSVRNFYISFEKAEPIVSKIPKTGRWTLDTMSYLPRKMKLTQFHTQLTPARNEFYAKYANHLLLETNAASLLETTWEHAHNALFDAIETYLLFKTEILGKKVLVGRR